MKKFLLILIILCVCFNFFSCATYDEEYWFGKEEDDVLFTYFSGIIEDKMAYKNRRRYNLIKSIWDSGYPLTANELNNMSFADLDKTKKKFDGIEEIVESGYYLKRSELNKLSYEEINDIITKLETIDDIMSEDWDLAKLGLNYNVLMRMSKDEVLTFNSKMRYISDLINRYSYYSALGFNYPNSVEELLKYTKEELEKLDDKAYYAWLDTEEGKIHQGQITELFLNAFNDMSDELDILTRQTTLRTRKNELDELQIQRSLTLKEKEEREQIENELEQLQKEQEEKEAKTLSSKEKAERRRNYK